MPPPTLLGPTLFFLEEKKGRSYGACVPLNIKDPRTDRLVRELAAATGESITTATRIAVEERLRRVRARRPDRELERQLADIVARGRQRPILDPRSPDEIIGYDENGLPSS